MPCGGIYPLDPSVGGECFVCRKPEAKHYCEEWDCFIHAICAIDFLQSPEGLIVIKHRHRIQLDFDLEERNEEELNLRFENAMQAKRS